MAPLTVRVRTPARMLRVTLDGDGTVATLRSAVAKELAIGLKEVGLLSLTPGGDAPIPDTTKLATLGMVNGAMFYASPTAASSAAAGAGAGASSSSSSSSSTNSAVATTTTPAAPKPTAPTLTARCQHGPGGACHHCLPPSDEDLKAKRNEPLNKAGRFSSRHVDKSAASADELSGDMEWLCRHRPDAMCTNCAPLHKGDKVELQMLCLHGPEARCTNWWVELLHTETFMNLPPDTTVDSRKFITWGEWAERRKARCEHAFTAFCVNCAPPRDVSYRMKPGCGRHPPWPRGICLDCSAPPVELASQPFRHVDYIQVHNFGEMSAFIGLWDANAAAGLQRCGLLYGRYRPDANFRHGLKAVVEAIFEPPQRCDPLAGTVALLPEAPRDVRAREAVTAALGLQQVGWIVTRRPPPKDAKGADNPAVSPQLLAQIAALQAAHPRADGLPGSRFVTLLVNRDASSGSIEPQGVMASDQLVSVVRDGVIAPPAPGDAAFKVHAPQPGEPPLPDVVISDMARGRHKSSSWDPDFNLVTLQAGTGHETAAKERADGGPMFRHASFPVENRRDFGIVQTRAALAAHLRQYRSEPYHHSMSDFHALLFMTIEFDTDTAVAVAQAVASGAEFSEGLQLIMQTVV